MNRRTIIFAILAVTLVTGLFLLCNWRSHSLATRLANLTQVMNLANAETRVQAELEILEFDPLQDTIRLKLAHTYINLGWYVTARQDLQQFNDRLEAQIIRVDSYLSQPKRIASQMSTSAEDRFAGLLKSAVRINAQLNLIPPYEALSTTVRPPQTNVRATLLRNHVRRQRAELANVRSIDIPGKIEKLGIIIDLRQQAACLDEQLTSACRHAINFELVESL